MEGIGGTGYSAPIWHEALQCPSILPQWLTLDTTLGRDLGLDSLNRVELVSRIEQSFNIGLPDYVAINAETPRDLLREIRGAHNPEPSRWLSAHEPFTPETTDTTENLNAPYHAVTLSEANA